MRFCLTPVIYLLVALSRYGANCSKSGETLVLKVDYDADWPQKLITFSESHELSACQVLSNPV